MDQKTILGWKSQYGKIYKLVLEKQDVYFRALTIDEITYMIGKNGMEKIVPDLVILNNVKLKLAGSYVHISKIVQEYSMGGDEDKIEEIAMTHRKHIKDDFALNIIANLCMVYPYNPDDLRKKTLDQLLELVAMAEVARGSNFIGVDDPRMSVPDMSNDTGKFEPPNTEKLMHESTDALSKAMLDEGGVDVPVFKKAPDKTLSPFHQQMKELNGV